MDEAMDVAYEHMPDEDKAMLAQMKPMLQEFGKTLQDSGVATGINVAMARADEQDKDMEQMNAEIVALKKTMDEYNNWAVAYRAEQRGNMLVMAQGLLAWAQQSDAQNTAIQALFQSWINALTAEATAEAQGQG